MTSSKTGRSLNMGGHKLPAGNAKEMTALGV